ncbi:hypothetical protein GSI_14834 [Ganoderma sinense ZZ0214-1]|uniref:Uncharacterized protein n=1 Tax=Ganoderma sinense ZZ0214-1 TaxID=1077348 RepID=A0A2G8RPT9_9APHY|nr:hypothetical protein GSI_14834 [Ganoderma sinense ZZ0214-1]
MLKVLLLGSAGSGKSTVLKQLRLAHGVPFSPQEIEFYRQHIFLNLTQGLKRVVDAMKDMGLEVSPENLDLVPILNDAKDVQDNKPYPAEYRDVLKRLWEDPNVQAAYARGNEAALPDYLQYFYADLDRFFKPSYVPTEKDIVHSYVPTTGISETHLTRLSRRGYDLLVVDVGGQNSEREKWIDCFENVACVVFVVNLSGYDQRLSEDKSTNQMMDTMTIWDSISQSHLFRWTPVVSSAPSLDRASSFQHQEKPPIIFDAIYR